MHFLSYLLSYVVFYLREIEPLPPILLALCFIKKKYFSKLKECNYHIFFVCNCVIIVELLFHY